MKITYTLQLFINGLKIEIPNFDTRNNAHMTGIFMQYSHNTLSLFEIKEVRDNG